MAYDAEITQKSRDLIVLERARDILAKGWCQNALEKSGSYCVVGALNVALCGRVSQGFTPGRSRLLSSLGLAPGCAVPWNNTPGRTQAEVLARFDAAIDTLQRVGV